MTRHVPRYLTTTDDTGRPVTRCTPPRLRRRNRHHQPDMGRRVEEAARPGRAEPRAPREEGRARMSENRCDKCSTPIPADTGAFCAPCADAVWDRFYDRHEDGDWE